MYIDGVIKMWSKKLFNELECFSIHMKNDTYKIMWYHNDHLRREIRETIAEYYCVDGWR